MARKNDSPQKAAMREMMRDYLKSNDISIKNGTDVNAVMRDMMSVLLEGTLDEEFDEELGYSKYDYRNKETDNSRNGHSSKTMHTSYGDMDIAIPRDRNGEYEPQLIKKYQNTVTQDMEEKILSMYDTPAAYHRRKGTYANMYTKGDSPLWTDYKVNSILNNEMYIGTFVYGKSRVKEVGSGRKQMLPPEEWKRIPDHHESLVSRAMYEQVQAMKGKVPEVFTPKGKRASVYTGRVVCDCCGRNMIYHMDRLGKRFFNCEVNYRKKNNCVNRVLVTDLDSIIKGELSRHISGLAKLKTLLDKEKEQQNERIRGAKQRLNMAEDTLRRLELELRTAYESYAKGITEKETYLMQKESYEVMISGIKEKIEAQKEAVFVLENQKPSDNSGLKFLEGNSEVAEITDELLDALLEKIVVYADKTIELRWKFSNRSN